MKLSDICDINKSNVIFTKDQMVDYLDTGNLTEGVIDSLTKVRYGDAPSRAQRAVEKDTILYSTVRPNLKHYGIVAEYNPNMVVSTGFTTIDVKENKKEEIDAHFLYYLMTQQWVTKHLHTIAQSSVSSYPSISPNDIGNLEFEYPLIATQRRIASVLSNIDKKIALNRQINANLEALAKQLYDYWFVQFDFPDANGKPYKSSGGKMVYNEKLKREIPDGWNICQLNEYILSDNTGDWGKDAISDGYFEVGCIRGADILSLIDLPKRYIKNEEKLLSEHDIVIEVSGGSPTQATGRSAYISQGVIERNGGRITCSNFCHAFTLKDYRKSAYFYYTWQLLYNSGNMFNYEGKTSGIKNFMTEMFLKNYWVDIPQNLSNKFFEKVAVWYSMKDANIAEIASLTKQRDELLPLLMNGQATIE